MSEEPRTAEPGQESPLVDAPRMTRREFGARLFRAVAAGTAVKAAASPAVRSWLGHYGWSLGPHSRLLQAIARWLYVTLRR